MDPTWSRCLLVAVLGHVALLAALQSFGRPLVQRPPANEVELRILPDLEPEENTTGQAPAAPGPEDTLAGTAKSPEPVTPTPAPPLSPTTTPTNPEPAQRPVPTHTAPVSNPDAKPPPASPTTTPEPNAPPTVGPGPTTAPTTSPNGLRTGQDSRLPATKAHGSMTSAGLGSAVARAAPSPPSYKSTPDPTYPASARRRRQEGVTLLDVRVGAQGQVLSLRLKTSSGVAALDQAAIEAVRGWQFDPARIDDTAIESAIEVPVRFKLK